MSSSISDIEQQLKRAKSVKASYLAVQTKVQELPKKLRHETKVDLGPLAFTHGYLYKTNELLVSLGDNYFVERSALQTSEIVARRLHLVDAEIATLEEQLPHASRTADDTAKSVPAQPAAFTLSEENVLEQEHGSSSVPTSTAPGEITAAATAVRPSTSAPVSDKEFQDIWDSLDDSASAPASMPAASRPAPSPPAPSVTVDPDAPVAADAIPAIRSPSDIYKLVSERLAQSNARIGGQKDSVASALRSSKEETPSLAAMRDARRVRFAAPTSASEPKHSDISTASTTSTSQNLSSMDSKSFASVPATVPHAIPPPSAVTAFSDRVIERTVPVATTPAAVSASDARHAASTSETTDVAEAEREQKATKPTSRFKAARMQGMR